MFFLFFIIYLLIYLFIIYILYIYIFFKLSYYFCCIINCLAGKSFIRSIPYEYINSFEDRCQWAILIPKRVLAIFLPDYPLADR